MVDTLTRAERSALMRRIRGKDTSPEWGVRRFLHRNGFRYRLRQRDLPGRPDIVLPKLRTVIFVHGCFWHRHPGCVKTSTPSTRRAFWEAKFKANVERDFRKAKELRAQGWKVVIIWECEVKETRLRRLLSQLRSQTQVRSQEPSLDSISRDEIAPP
jgi:DNA mismatch endonuclease (patch repair protein)